MAKVEKVYDDDKIDITNMQKMLLCKSNSIYSTKPVKQSKYKKIIIFCVIFFKDLNYLQFILLLLFLSLSALINLVDNKDNFFLSKKS